MSNEQQQQHKLAKWDTVMVGCNHRQIMSEKDLAEPIEERYNPETGHKGKLLRLSRLCGG